MCSVSYASNSKRTEDAIPLADFGLVLSFTPDGCDAENDPLTCSDRLDCGTCFAGECGTMRGIQRQEDGRCPYRNFNPD